MQNILKFITCGSVDDGKSTLIGRLLYDTNSIFTDQLETLENDSKKYGTQKENIDFALLTDGLLSERDQGITIDVAYKYFDTRSTKFIIADTPGHEQYTRNMATAASNTNASVILVDATKGVSLQTKRHLYITTLFGVKDIIVAVNKMDLVNYSQDVFESIKNSIEQIVEVLNVENLSFSFIPCSALDGDNIVTKSINIPWYQGQTLLETLETIAQQTVQKQTSPLRVPIQYVNRPDSNFRGYAGTIASGKLSVGDKIRVTPSNKTTTVKSIITYDGNLNSASKDEAVTITLENELDISRSDVITHEDDKATLSDSFESTIVWMDDEQYDSQKQYKIKIATLNINAKVTINSTKDLATFEDVTSSSVNINDIATCTIELDKKVLLDSFKENQTTGSFILVDPYTNTTAATGIIKKVNEPKRNIFVHEHSITKELRAKSLNQKPLIIWLTGLSASGKSTIANELEKQLHLQGLKTYLLDGDNLRNGLNSDLGFSKEDREENIRRVAHIAQLMFDAGLIVITAFISPFEKERAYARSLVKNDEFIEVFVDTPIEVCEQRDTKGLYKKAKDGVITDFTGISSPYERPNMAEIVLKEQSVSQSIEKIMKYLEGKL